ncbi:HECA2 protein, partial [Anseranas semipalmata]|nr:HECA2 protein [Anseranas semipalmata]
GRNLGFLIEIPQDTVNGTVGQSVLLPVSYRFNSTPQFPVAIRWMFGTGSHAIISCSVPSCSLGAGGAPESCSTRCFPAPAYRGRFELFPENASLLLRDLRLSDSGVYSVTFQQQNQTRHITLTVHEPRVSPNHPGEGAGQGAGGTAARMPCYVLGACYCFILLLLQLLFHLQWLRGSCQQQGRPGQA